MHKKGLPSSRGLVHNTWSADHSLIFSNCSPLGKVYCAGYNLHSHMWWPWPGSFPPSLSSPWFKSPSFLPCSVLLTVIMLTPPATLPCVPFVFLMESGLSGIANTPFFTWLRGLSPFFFYPFPCAFYSPAVQMDHTSSSLISLCLEYPFYS